MNPTKWGIKIIQTSERINPNTKLITIDFETYVVPIKKRTVAESNALKKNGSEVMYATNHALQNLLNGPEFQQQLKLNKKAKKEIWLGTMQFLIVPPKKEIYCDIYPFKAFQYAIYKKLMHIGIGSLIERQCIHCIRKKFEKTNHPIGNYDFISETNSPSRQNQLRKTKRPLLKTTFIEYYTVNKLDAVAKGLSEYIAKGTFEHKTGLTKEQAEKRINQIKKMQELNKTKKAIEKNKKLAEQINLIRQKNPNILITELLHNLKAKRRI